MEQQGKFVDIPDIECVNHRTFINIAHIRNLVLQFGRQRRFASTHDDVRLDTTAANFSYRVLCRFGLLFARRTDKWNEGDVDVADVVSSCIVSILANRFKERKNLNVTDGAADFCDDDVNVIGRDTLNATLDLIGDVRNDLNGLAQILTLALGRHHRLINRTGGRI